MRSFVLAMSAALALSPAISMAQAPAPATAVAARYTTAATDIGTLLDNPATKAILEKHVPGMTTSDQIGMARSMTLRDIQPFAGDQITDKVLAAIDADLAKLSEKN